MTESLMNMTLIYELEDLRETDAFKTMKVKRKGLEIGLLIIDKEYAHISNNKYKEMIIQ